MTVTTTKIKAGCYNVFADGVLVGYIFSTGKYGRTWNGTNAHPITGETVNGAPKFRTGGGLKDQTAASVARHAAAAARHAAAAAPQTVADAVAACDANGGPLFSVSLNLPQDVIDAYLAKRASRVA